MNCAAGRRRHTRRVAAGYGGYDDSTAVAVTVVVLLSAVWVVATVQADDYGLPTEVVEEWGCHDTELRLTCGSLDTTIAILEATYTPNCSGLSDDDDCIHIDYKKLTRSYTASPRVDSHPSESDAARQFLDALQRSRLEAERIGEQQHQSAAARHPSSDFISTKSKRNSLRDALEELIVDFLRELTPGSSTSGSSIRYRRSARQTDEYEQDGQADEIREEDDETGEQDVNDMRRIEIGSRNITVLPTQRVREPQRIGRPSECAELRRRVTKLDQYELDKALMKDGESRELNIRRVLNHRCSGKNHCSFAFATDYPFSILWHDGKVRIKYICMNNFRLNKFCHERLHIDNEPEPKLQPSPAAASQQADRKGEPVAEARIASDQSFHHLKILTSGSGDASDAIDGSVPDAASQPDDVKRRRKPSSRVYSQDFKFFKIIPSHVNTNHTAASGPGRTLNESATNAIYWKVNPRLAASAAPATTTDETTVVDIETRPSMITEFPPKHTPTTIAPTTIAINPIEHVIETKTTTTMTTKTTTTTNTTDIQTTTETTKDSHKPSSVSTTNNSQLDTFFDADVEEIDDNDIAQNVNGYNNDKYVEEPPATADSDEEDHSYEDYAVESYDRTVVRKNKVRVHTSFQIASAFTGLPLRQGFLATTGYPRYYIGDSNCSWTLTAPIGHRVRLTVLDLNLRVDERCRDVLEIIDQNNVIFSGCQELAKSMQIVSDSNEIRVSVRTTSRLAYPKRGVLIHYTAMGCLLLPVPANGRLVHTARDTAKYACQAAFVFADTAASSRELHCTEHYTWDKSLPDCIEPHLLQPNAIVADNHTADDTRYNRTLHSLFQRPPSAAVAPNRTKMADKTTDMLYDVAIPSMIIASLFIVNAVIFLVIMRCRNKRKNDDDFNTHEMSRL